MYKFEKLQIWKESILYAKNIYRAVDKFPKTEMFGLTMQLKRASVSISSNIAEGSGMSGNKHFSHYIDIAMGSTIETISQLLLAKELEFIDDSVLDVFYAESEILIRKLQSFKKSLIKTE